MDSFIARSTLLQVHLSKNATSKMNNLLQKGTLSSTKQSVNHKELAFYQVHLKTKVARSTLDAEPVATTKHIVT